MSGDRKIDLWSTCPPDVHQVRQRPRAWILTGLVSGANQRGVDIHRQRVFGFTGFGDSIYVTRKVPGQEDFIRSWPPAKDFLPGTARLKAVCSPYRAEFRDKAIFVLLQIVHQLEGRRLIEKPVRNGAAVT